MFAQSSSETVASDRLRSANCCAIFGLFRSYSSLSCFSRASLEAVGFKSAICTFCKTEDKPWVSQVGRVMWDKEMGRPTFVTCAAVPSAHPHLDIFCLPRPHRRRTGRL